MGLAAAIIAFATELLAVGGRLVAGSITEQEARQQSADATERFAAQLAASRADDIQRDAATDARLDEIDRRSRS